MGTKDAIKLWRTSCVGHVYVPALPGTSNCSGLMRQLGDLIEMLHRVFPQHTCAAYMAIAPTVVKAGQRSSLRFNAIVPRDMLHSRRNLFSTCSTNVVGGGASCIIEKKKKKKHMTESIHVIVLETISSPFVCLLTLVIIILSIILWVQGRRETKKPTKVPPPTTASPPKPQKSLAERLKELEDKEEAHRQKTLAELKKYEKYAYDPTSCASLDHFQPVKKNTHCVFSPASKVSM